MSFRGLSEINGHILIPSLHFQVQSAVKEAFRVRLCRPGVSPLPPVPLPQVANKSAPYAVNSSSRDEKPTQPS